MIRRLAPFLLFPSLVLAQAPSGPPSVGVAKVEQRPVTESSEYVGRIQAMDRVDITARVTAFLDARLFTEGTEVAAGTLLYRLERAPFEAALASQDAAIAQAQARADQADVNFARVESLQGTPAALRSAFDDARANRLAARAALDAAKAQALTARINLDYTEIHAPIAGKIGRANIAVGNVVGPTSGPLTTIVSQDPMYVVFPIPVRVLMSLEQRHAATGIFGAVLVRIRLPDGRIYAQPGQIDYKDPTIAANTDTIILRAKIPNPVRRPASATEPVDRELIDGAFVGVSVQGAEPVMMVTIPRAAVLADVQGNFVWVIGADNKAERRGVTLGQSTAQLAVIASGLNVGETVVVDGVQRVRPGQPVNPAPVTPAPAASAARP
jgi:membrane fusion protein (multidrug efflux system)